MSSKAAAAMYPALAKQERQMEAQRQAELRAKSEPITQPAWGKSNDPMWAEPRKGPNGLDRVPGLRRK
jgi:hypothetical protein